MTAHDEIVTAVKVYMNKTQVPTYIEVSPSVQNKEGDIIEFNGLDGVKLRMRITAVEPKNRSAKMLHLEQVA